MAEIPDFYADQVNMNVSPFGVNIAFGTRSFDGEPDEDDPVGQAETKGIVRMGHLHAKIVTMMMARILKSYEEREGVIRIPDKMLQTLELESDNESW